MGFSRKENRYGLPFPFSGDLSGDQTCISLHWQADCLPLSHLGNQSDDYFIINHEDFLTTSMYFVRAKKQSSYPYVETSNLKGCMSVILKVNSQLYFSCLTFKVTPSHPFLTLTFRVKQKSQKRAVIVRSSLFIYSLTTYQISTTYKST